MSLVHFIIPSLGRSSLKRTLISLKQQTIPDWTAQVIYDGVLPTSVYFEEEKRIRHLFIDKQDGGAGAVRNIGLDKLYGKWTAFVDDDDYLSNKYIERIKYWGEKGYNLIQFTYRDVENGNTQPPDNLNHLVECNFGISFAVDTAFIQEHNIRFTKGGVEDYRFLKDCLDKGANYVITHEKIYFVGHRSAWGER